MITWLGKIAYFSGTKGKTYKTPLQAFSAHLEYVTKKASHIDGNVVKLVEHASNRILERKNARYAMKFFVPLPNSWLTKLSKAKQCELVKDFLSNSLGIDKNKVLLCFHDDPNNYHVHVVIGLDKNFKMSPADLKRFHEKFRNWIHKLNEVTFNYAEFIKEKVKTTVPNSVYKSLNLRHERNKIMAELKKIHISQSAQLKTIISLLHNTSDSFWIVAINRKNNQVIERKLSKEISDSMASYLRHLNAQGYDIYFSLNPYNSNAPNRNASHVKTKTKAIYLDIDGSKHNRDGNEILEEIIQKENIPYPTLVIQTSSQNIQAIYVLKEEVEFNKLQKVMKCLNEKYNLDATHDPVRIFRLPAFKNWKHGNFTYLRKNSSKLTYSFNSFTHLLEVAPILDKLESKQEKMNSTRAEGEKKSSETNQYLSALLDLVQKKYDCQLNVSMELAKHSCSEIDFAVFKELAKVKRFSKEELISAISSVIKVLRPNKIARSRHYPEYTADAILNSIKKEQSSKPSYTTKTGSTFNPGNNFSPIL